MRRSIVDSSPLADVSGCIVWINMLEGDTEVTTRESARIVEDPRFRHFRDPQKRSGTAIAERMGGQDRVAWDIYLFFAKGSEWREDPPSPTDWRVLLQVPPTRPRKGW